MQIHETAFIISTYRSLYPEVSKDPYAHLWNNPKTNELLPEILDTISKHEPLMHSLRNRFFLEELTTFFEQHPNGTFLNFGAGFSMYQFVLPKSVQTIEIDKKDIVDYKKEKITTWIKEGVIPKRNIKYLSMDFNTISVAKKADELLSLLSNTPTFILLEGVLFFLNADTTNQLFKIFGKIQKSGDILGSVSYDPKVKNTEVYQKLLTYFDKNNNTNDTFAHQTLPLSFYQNQEEYEVIKHTDEFEIVHQYAPHHLLPSKTRVLNESLYVLKRH
ncbi:class I SAM-dependent methyltransferase [Aquimarina sp. W85]|uniref:class I SAM-dependent methyltransferase n=1 Tax=Aquimarina rhodophyticola TaxID=3342246 RepID=UPI00366DB2C9